MTNKNKAIIVPPPRPSLPSRSSVGAEMRTALLLITKSASSLILLSLPADREENWISFLFLEADIVVSFLRVCCGNCLLIIKVIFFFGNDQLWFFF